MPISLRGYIFTRRATFQAQPAGFQNNGHAYVSHQNTSCMTDGHARDNHQNTSCMTVKLTTLTRAMQCIVGRAWRYFNESHTASVRDTLADIHYQRSSSYAGKRLCPLFLFCHVTLPSHAHTDTHTLNLNVCSMIVVDQHRS